MVTRFLPAAAGSVVLALMIAARPLGAIARGIAIGCLVAAWLVAALVRRVDVRAHASVVAALAGVIAAGQVEGGALYGAAAIAFVVACAVSMRAARRAPGADDTRSSPRGLRIAGVVLAAVAAPTAALLIVGLPPLAGRVERYVSAQFGFGGDEQTAFSTTMILGATRGMLVSDEIVMRIEGDHPEYLRGAVYDRYDGRYWVMTGGRERTKLAASAPASRSTMRITLARSAPRGQDMRWFLPPGACDLGVSEGSVEVDGFGVVRRGKDEEPRTITLRMHGCEASGLLVAPPSNTDLDLRNDVRAQLTPIAVAWASQYSTRRERLDAIRRELQKLEYSLSVPRDPDKDPVVDFLTVHRAGHCEMFASAMVLLARTIDIPARVVGGYRVDEVNPLTGKLIVRDRNAHAWVEAWVDGAWRAFDPTPISEGFRRRPGTLDQIGDVVSSAIDRIGVALGKLTTFDLLALLGAAIVVLLGVRSALARLRARRERRSEDAATPPLPCFDELSAALADAGHVRADAEPIETFARRIRSTAAPWARDTADALLAYAGLRYGGIGAEDEIVRRIERAAKQVRD
jgi:hypothetical protein